MPRIIKCIPIKLKHFQNNFPKHFPNSEISFSMHVDCNLHVTTMNIILVLKFLLATEKKEEVANCYLLSETYMYRVNSIFGFSFDFRKWNRLCQN